MFFGDEHPDVDIRSVGYYRFPDSTPNSFPGLLKYEKTIY